jgi:excisionase family DNA binding protein
VRQFYPGVHPRATARPPWRPGYAKAVTKVEEPELTMTKKTTTRITIETERLLVVSRSRNFASWCPSCLAPVQRLSVDEAAALARVDSLTVYRWIDAGAIHFAQTDAGVPLLCAASLRDFCSNQKG